MSSPVVVPSSSPVDVELVVVSSVLVPMLAVGTLVLVPPPPFSLVVAATGQPQSQAREPGSNEHEWFLQCPKFPERYGSNALGSRLRTPWDD